MRAAVVVLGSDACRLVVAEPTSGGWFRTRLDRRVVLGLGRTVRRDGQLGAGLIELTAETARRFVGAAFVAGADRVVALVEHGVVAGSDGGDLRRRVAEAATVTLEVVDADRLAAATTRAVARRLALPAPPTTVTVGGDRVRVAYAGHAPGPAVQEVHLGLRDVVPVAVVDPLHPAASSAIHARLRDRVAPLRRLAEDATPGSEPPATVRARSSDTSSWPVLVGGPAVTLARAVVGRRWGVVAPAVDGARISDGVLADLERELLLASGTGRMLLPGLDPADVDEVAVTLLTVRSTLERLGAPGVVASSVGAHEGFVLTELEPAPGDEPDRDPLAAQGRGDVTVRERAVAAIATRHTEHVADLASQLFDRVGHGLGLDERDRCQLLTAARVHDVGRSGPDPATGTAAHRQGADQLLTGGLPGVAPDDLVELACLVRFRIGRPPGPHFPPYGRLPPRRRRAVERMTALLRLACALDASGSGTVTTLHLDVDPDLWCVHAFGAGDRSLELHAVESQLRVVSALVGVGVVVRAAPSHRGPTERRATV